MMFEIHVLMALCFLDRDEEQRRLRRFLLAGDSSLAVLYGRRRCGKSTLLQRVCGAGDVYALADERESTLQIQALATEVARVVPEFDSARYPTWDALFVSLAARVERLSLVLDEFPYLVASAPELPSVIQRHLDRPGPRRLGFILCGSSQRMMQGLALDRSAPLYGRAQEILRLTPLRPGWIAEALRAHGAAAVEAWAVWGGVPRYWELAERHPSLQAAIRDLVLHRHGVLHDEPQRLLLDDMRSATQATTLLALVGAGCHRLSEIAARMGKPAGALTRALSNLIDLGYLRKDIPFGEDERTSKRTLYRIDDPLVAFWFRFVQPARTLLQRDLLEPVEASIRTAFSQHCGEAWEVLARESVPRLPIGDIAWGPASRWWGNGPDGPLEFNVVAESLDGASVLIGEAEWASRADLARWRADLRKRAESAPFLRGRRLVCALWSKEGVEGADLVTPAAVMAALR
jgi:AAA+ ATPase superfamily predicted ATPase